MSRPVNRLRGGVRRTVCARVSGERVAQEGRDKFEAFFVGNYEDVVRLAYVLSGDRRVAEEVTQEAFLRLFARWGRLRNPAGWVRTVAANLARSRLRRVAAEARALSRLGGLTTARTAEVDLSDDVEEFWRLVRSLPHRQAQAVALHYGEDRSVADVASLMGCAEGTVKALLHKARHGLAELLSQPQPGIIERELS